MMSNPSGTPHDLRAHNQVYTRIHHSVVVLSIQLHATRFTPTDIHEPASMIRVLPPPLPSSASD